MNWLSSEGENNKVKQPHALKLTKLNKKAELSDTRDPCVKECQNANNNTIKE